MSFNIKDYTAPPPLRGSLLSFSSLSPFPPLFHLRPFCLDTRNAHLYRTCRTHSELQSLVLFGSPCNSLARLFRLMGVLFWPKQWLGPYEKENTAPSLPRRTHSTRNRKVHTAFILRSFVSVSRAYLISAACPSTNQYTASLILPCAYVRIEAWLPQQKQVPLSLSLSLLVGSRGNKSVRERGEAGVETMRSREEREKERNAD